MSQKYKRVIIAIVVICIVVLFIDMLILVLHKSRSEDMKTYFDSVNEFSDSGDNIIAVGSNNNNDNSYEKAKITLYNRNYEKKWETLYNKKYNSSFFSVAEDNNSYIAVGNREANKQEHENKVRSALIAKYDKDGRLLAENSFQVLGNSKFTKIRVVEDGYLVVGQSIYENMTLGLSDEGGAFLIKYDKDLHEVWKKNYGGSKSGIYNDFIIIDNAIYTVGKDASRIGIVSKYSLNGEFISNVNYEYTDTLGFSEIVSDGNYLYVVGAKKIKEDQNNYDTDAVIIKYDFDLNLIKETIYTGKGMERYNGIILDSNSNLVLIGQTGIYDEEKSTSSMNIFHYNGLLVKYNLDLKELLVEEYGEDRDDYFTDLKQVEDKYLISGYSTYDNSFISKFITYTKSGKLLEVE